MSHRSGRLTGVDDLQVTRVGPDDWQRLRAVRLAALAESPEMFGSTHAREVAFAEEEWRARAARPVTFLAALGGADVGIAGAYELDDRWSVMSMWVAPQARGTGVLEALAGACESVVREAGATALHLTVMEDNARGLRAYERLGYRLTGDRTPGRDGRDELWMTKPLA